MYAIIFHAHQKLDRLAYEGLKLVLNEDTFFPDLKDIIYFEGKNGPDSAKLKKHISADQPWHFIDPHKRSDKYLKSAIRYHFEELKISLAKEDEIRSAFEAAWLAHALVDGLTPAHHHPYEKELEHILGVPKEARVGLYGRAYVKTGNLQKSVAQSLKLIGPKGLITTHAMFEAGAYLMTAPLKQSQALTQDDLDKLVRKDIYKIFKRYLKDIASLNIYNRYNETGWTKPLKKEFKEEVLPRMIHIVTLAWYSAALQAEKH